MNRKKNSLVSFGNKLRLYHAHKPIFYLELIRGEFHFLYFWMIIIFSEEIEESSLKSAAFHKPQFSKMSFKNGIKGSYFRVFSSIFESGRI